MRPEAPTFFPLNSKLDWLTQFVDHIAVGKDTGIKLAADADGPLSLNNEDGSLGGLVLPRGMAIDNTHLLYLLDQEAHCVRRYDPYRNRFIILPTVGGTEQNAQHEIGDNVRQFTLPNNIAIAGNSFYVVDSGACRVQVFALDSLVLQNVWGPWDQFQCNVEADADDVWQPIDIASSGNKIYVLDRRYARVFMHRAGTNSMDLLFQEPHASNRWTRIVVDSTGRIYVLDPSVPQLEVYDYKGQKLKEVKQAGDLLGYFPPPAVRLDYQGRFCLPQEMAKLCLRQAPITPVSPVAPLFKCRNDSERLFNQIGMPITLPADPETVGPYLYQRQGIWISQALDSKIYNCQWHRIEISFADLPAGSKLIIDTYADNQQRSSADIQTLPEHLWNTKSVILGKMQASTHAGVPVKHNTDALILSYEGQFLWLRLQLFGDGYSTPVVDAIKAHYPRESYLEYLPAIYSSDDESRRFMGHFLEIFKTTWDELEEKIDRVVAHLDPRAVPGGKALAYLADWLSLPPFEQSWSEEQKRHLLKATPQFYRHRGTKFAVMRYLQVYLTNIIGLPASQQHPFPILVEGFRYRNYLMLSNSQHSPLNSQHPLWSATMVARLQLDVYARESEVRLVSTGDPQRDVFHVHAHKFQVYIPSAWIKSRCEEDMVYRALEWEKPAHTSFQLCLVEARFRVGVQATVGVDTIVGDYPVAILADAEQENTPRTLLPRHCLGYDTILACKAPASGGMQLDKGKRVGMNTRLS